MKKSAAHKNGFEVLVIEGPAPSVVSGEEAQAAPVAAVAAPPAQPVGVGDTEHDHQLVPRPRLACSHILTCIAFIGSISYLHHHSLHLHPFYLFYPF